MRKLGIVFLLAVLGMASSTAMAQSNELALTFGPQFPSGSNYGFGHSWAVQANFAHRIVNAVAANLYVELPLVWGRENTRRFSPAGLRDHYTSFFITPGLRLKLLPQFPISPYGVVGAGFARFRRTETDQVSRENVIDYGLGADWKIAPFLSARGEWRDFNSGVPRLEFPNPGSRQHNHMVTVGLVARF